MQTFSRGHDNVQERLTLAYCLTHYQVTTACLKGLGITTGLSLGSWLWLGQGTARRQRIRRSKTMNSAGILYLVGLMVYLKAKTTSVSAKTSVPCSTRVTRWTLRLTWTWDEESDAKLGYDGYRWPIPYSGNVWTESYWRRLRFLQQLNLKPTAV